jgi:polyhydroxybutyrate depolymerase
MIRNSGQFCLKIFVLLITISFSCFAGHAQSGKVIQWKIGDTTRKAMVYIPVAAKEKPTPVVFIYHGHGGSMNNVYNKYRVQELWPEAIVICPQGLNTPGALTDPKGERSGWQQDKGFQQDRDLIFFDTLMSYINRNYNVDKNRIYVTGHSNGGSFTYLLWAQRGDIFAAVAPTASVARHPDQFHPKPCFIMMGEKDELVNPVMQTRSFKRIQLVNGCAEQGEETGKFITSYKCKDGNDLVLLKHPGGHAFYKGTEEEIVRFFKEHPGKQNQ